MKNAVFWDVAQCSSFLNRRFGGTYHLHLQSREIYERRTRVRRRLQFGSSLADFSTPKIETIHSSETSVHTRTTLCRIPENNIIYSRTILNLIPVDPFFKSTSIILKKKKKKISWDYLAPCMCVPV
jgi:hypothetical protein